MTLDGKQVLTLRPAGGGEEVEVRAVAGKHTLEVHKGGFKITTKEFVLNDGQPNRPISVKLEPLGPKRPRRAAMPAAPANAAGDRDRQAAEWTIRFGRTGYCYPWRREGSEKS